MLQREVEQMKHNIGKLFLICLILSCLSLYIIPPASGTVWADEIKDPETVQDIPTENMEVPDSPHDQTESAAEFPEDGIGTDGERGGALDPEAEEAVDGEGSASSELPMESETESMPGEESGEEVTALADDERPDPVIVSQSLSRTRSVGDTGRTYAMYMAVVQPIAIPAFGEGVSQVWEHIIQTGGDTRTAYCMEYGVPLGAGTQMTWTDMSPQAQKEIGYALHFGWKYQAYDEAVYQDETNRTEYAMTQAVIWSIVSGIFDTEAGDAACRQVADASHQPDHAWAYYIDLKNAILSAERIPSFAGRNSDGSDAEEIVLTWDSAQQCYTATVYDENDRLGYFDFAMDGVSFEREGNRLTLSTQRRLEKASLSLPAVYETGGGAQAAVIWDAAGGQQDLVTEYEAAVSCVQAYVKLRTEEPELTIPVKVNIFKKDKVTGNGLTGAVFDVYQNGIKSGTMEDMGNGNYTYETSVLGRRGDLVKTSLRIVEVQAPEGYLSSGWEKIFEGEDMAEEGSTILYEAEVENEAIQGRISLLKSDARTGERAQGEGSLAGAVYDVFAAEDIYTPDGTRRQYAAYKDGDDRTADSYVTSLVTDEAGRAESDLLTLGKYMVIEREASSGYKLDETQYQVDLRDDGQNIPVQSVSVHSKEEVIAQPVALIKTGDGGSTGEERLAGAGFEFYLRSTLDISEDGTWDFDSAEPVVVTEEGGTELFTDDDGQGITIPLPFGVYIVRESTVPHNYKACQPFEVTIDTDSTVPQEWRHVANESFKAQLKIIKQDSETGETIWKAGAKFRIRNMDTGEYVRKADGFLDLFSQTVFEADDTGTLILPLLLKPGTYQIEESEAPEGYVAGGPIRIVVDEEGFYQMDAGTPTLTVVVENTPQKGRIEVLKQGETAADYGKRNLLSSFRQFKYVLTELKDVSFEVYADEDIFSPDGHGRLIYEKDMLIGVMLSDEEGRAMLEDLPLGRYRIVETETAEGFLVGDVPLIAELTWDKSVARAEWSHTYVNDREKISVRVWKRDCESQAGLEGAQIGLYAGQDILDPDGNVLVNKDMLLETVTTDPAGQGMFKTDLPTILPDGSKPSYYVRELEAPEGYVLSTDTLEVDLSQTDAEGMLDIFLENEPVTVQVEKLDAVTEERVSGAQLAIYRADTEGRIVSKQPWKVFETDGNGPYVIRGIPAGDYVLREEKAPIEKGYVTAADIHFQVKAKAGIQKVVMREEYTKIAVSKKDASDGSMLAGAILELYNAGGECIRTWESQETPETIAYLPPGPYRIVEKTAPEGYALAEDLEFNVEEVAALQEINFFDQKENNEMIHPGSHIATGDAFPIIMLAAVCLLSLSMLLLLLKKYKKS